MSEEGGVPARWLAVSVEVPFSGAADLLVPRLLELGGRAVVEDGGRLVTHLAEPPDPEALVGGLRRWLADAFPGLDPEVRLEWQPHREWSEVWRRGLAPRRVTSRLVVTPSWCRPDAGPGDVVIVVDPGMAFGTAEHGTTRGCLRLLDDVLRPGDRVLDVGTGSGILAIAAALLGAADVLAMEADPWAAEPARENVAANGVADRVEVRTHRVTAEELRARGPRDGVTANLETDALRRLLPGLRDAVRPGGWVVLGGIEAPEWDAMVAAAARAGLALETVDADGEWRSGCFRRG